jgi:ADP-ribose pyrophosphatase YjhB (NUDIX family)
MYLEGERVIIMPGGSIEANESLVQALHREFDEETGMKMYIIDNVGTTEFIVKYQIQENTHIQHIAIFVEVEVKDGDLTGNSASDDTSGIEWIYMDRINEGNSSSLVIAAKEYLITIKLEYLSRTYDTWKVKEDQAWEGFECHINSLELTMCSWQHLLAVKQRLEDFIRVY